MDFDDVQTKVIQSLKASIDNPRLRYVDIFTKLDLDNDEMVTFAVLLEKNFDVIISPEDIENKTIDEISTAIFSGLFI